MARRNENNLTDKWQIFCDALLADEKMNGTEAYRQAYPKVSQRAAEVNAAKLLGKAEVQEYLDKARAERAERCKVDSDYVLKRLVEIDELDVIDIIGDNGGLLPIREWPKPWRRYISGFDVAEIFEGKGDEREIVGVLKKIKWPDKLKNLELLGKHLKVGAFVEKVDHTTDGEALSPTLIEIVAKQ